MPATNFVRFCQNPLCIEVHVGCLPHNKNVSDKTVHHLQLTSAWIRSLKTRAKHYILLFFAILHDKRNISSFMLFFQAPYTKP